MHNSKLNYKQNFAHHPVFSLVAFRSIRLQTPLIHNHGKPA